MPTNRDPNRRAISVWLDKDLLKVIEHARLTGKTARSSFLRDAIVHYLQFLGYKPHEFHSPPTEEAPVLPKPISIPGKKINTKINMEAISASSGGTNNVHLNYHEAPKKVGKEKYAEGTIGRNADMRNYIAYLIGRYYEFKKADLSFGKNPVEHARIMNGLYPVVNNTIRKNFGAYPNGVTTDRFHALELFLQAKIDGTILGKVQKKKGHTNYKSFEEFCELGAG